MSNAASRHAGVLSRSEMWAPWVAAALALAVYLPFLPRIGFLSDDFFLLTLARERPFTRPLEGHHYAPAVHALYLMAGRGALSATGLGLLSLAFHLANCFLAGRVFRQLGLPALAGAGALLLFGLSSAGSESLLSRSSIGYVLTASWVLIGATLTLDALKARRRAGYGLALLLVQVAAWLCWDWAVLLAPVAALVALAKGRAADGAPAALPRTLLCLLPAVTLSLLWMATRGTLLGLEHGYGLNSPGTALKVLLVCPVYTLLPEFGAWGSPGWLLPVLAATLTGAFILCALRGRLAALMVALYYLCLTPAALFGAVQWRYLYLPGLFFYAAVFLTLRPLSRGAASGCSAARPAPRTSAIRPGLAALLLAGLLLWQGGTTIRLARLWESAYAQAQKLLVEIEAVPHGDEAQVLVNLPDTYGPPGMVLKPYVWRNGLEFVLGRPLTLLRTADADYAVSTASLLERERLCDEVAGRPVHEIIRTPGQGWREYSLIRLCPAEKPSPGP